jgi:hypothetical protein
MKFGLSYKGKNIPLGCLRTGCWGEYLDLQGKEIGDEVGGNCIMGTLKMYTLHQMLLG